MLITAPVAPKHFKMLDRIRTLEVLQYARKMHVRYFKLEKSLTFNWLRIFRIRVQLPPAPPIFDILKFSEVYQARMEPALRAFLRL